MFCNFLLFLCFARLVGWVWFLVALVVFFGFLAPYFAGCANFRVNPRGVGGFPGTCACNVLVLGVFWLPAPFWLLFLVSARRAVQNAIIFVQNDED